MKRTVSLLSLVTILGLSTVLGAAEPAAPETKEARDQRMAWWREARFGMFIHWGLYAVPGGEWKGKKVDGLGEWILNGAQIKLADYEPLAKQFNPVKFDARAWARIARKAGMKYIVITSKHHDGFGLWDSKLTDWCVRSTPFQRDILAELAEATKAEGVKFCFYHSIMDWHHPDYLPRRAWDPRPGAAPDYSRYVEYMKGQLAELVTRYHPPVLWFDGEWEDTWTHEHGKMLYDYCRSLDPKLIVNNRVDKGRQGMEGLTKAGDFAGDFGTPEQEIPATGLAGVDWETCMTMNDTWGFRKDDTNWKTTEDLLRKLIDIASKGGNFLLNVGPTPEGLIPEPSVERLAALGKWLDRNGDSIYGTSASPFKSLAWGRATQKPGKLYLHVFDWPSSGSLEVPGLASEVRRAYQLTEPSAALKTKAGASGVSIALPAKAPDAISSTIVLEIEGEPKVSP